MAMPCLHPAHRLPILILGGLMAALLTTQAMAQVQIDYTNGQTDATIHDTSAPNSPTTLSILSGTATQSGVLTGSGSVIKAGTGTVILSGLNNYTGSTAIIAGTLQVAVGGAISHSGSNLAITGQISDAATLLITGGSVSNSYGTLADSLGSSGTASVSGGSWTTTSYIIVGDKGTGVLNLSGGSISDNSSTLGVARGSSGTANVSGGIWTNTTLLSIGDNGTAVLNLSGGSITSQSGNLGNYPYGNGTANVSGGTWTSGSLNIGFEGIGLLNLSGGSLITGTAYIGNLPGSSGTANISGGTWTNGGTLYVGGSGTGVLNISGGSVSDDSVNMGYFPGLNSTANVSGGTWTTNSALNIGYLGTGVLNLTGGSVSSGTGTLGSFAGSSGTANVSNGTWTMNTSFYLGSLGTGVLNLTGGSVSNGIVYLGDVSGSSGTANVSGGTWTNDGNLNIGNYGTGVLNLSGGSITTKIIFQGVNAGSSSTVNVSNGTLNATTPNSSSTYFIGLAGSGVLNLSGGSITNGYSYLGVSSGGSGTVNMSGGSWTNKADLNIGQRGTGVLNLSGGTLSSTSGILGFYSGSTGTATVSGGEWTTNYNLYVGYSGTGVLNLTDSGTVTVLPDGSGTLTLANFAGSSGTLNIGTGGAAGTLNAAAVSGVSGTATVNFNHTGSYSFTSALRGSLSVNHIGPGTTTLTAANTYAGATNLLAGTLELSFGTVSTNILPSSTALTLGGGTLRVTGAGSQTVNGLTTTAGTASQIVSTSGNSLNLGALTAAGSGSALNFNTAAGGANGSAVGTSAITLTGQTAGAVINTAFTVTDSTGFGLATVNAVDQIIRLTTGSDLLPASGAVAGTDYRIDNNNGNNGPAGSASLIVTDSQSARSITVDTTTASGILTLAPGAVLSTDVWNFGGTGGNTYAITTDPGTSGLSAATAGGVLQINNYNSSTVSINAPILDNSDSGLRVGGTGTTLLNGSASYTGETAISNGTVFINGDFSAATGDVTVQNTATLSGDGALGGALHVQSGGILKPGNFAGLGAFSGTSATFDSGSIFSIQGSGSTLPTLHLTGAVTITSGALLSLDTTALTASSYTLITAASGLDSAHGFTLSAALPTGYELVYDGTTLKLQSTAPITAFWTGKVDSNWSTLSSGTSNWSTAVDGVTDTAALPAALTDVTFSATGVGQQQTNLDVDFTIKSLTVDTATTVSITGTHTLTVNNATTVNALLAINTGVTLLGKGDLTVSTSGNLAGSGSVEMAVDHSIIVNGAISVGDPNALPGAQVLSLTTSGTGAIVMGADSIILVNLYTGAGLGDNTASLTAADQLSLHGTLNATAGGTLVIGNPTTMTSYAGGDQWKVINPNSGAGTITGHLALNDSALALATGFIGTLDQATGIYSIADHRPELSASSSGLAMANAEGQAIISGVQTALNDVNNHLFNLRSGGGEEEEDGSISAAIDYGVVVGEGDGPEDKNPIAKHIKRSRQWQVFTTVNYGNARLNPISNQAGVQIDSWASSVGIERHVSRSVTVGFAATFLQSTQTYTGGLGKVDLEGPMLSAYLSYARRGFWGSLLYSFGAFDLGSQRNPGLGLPSASGGTNAYTNAIQYNTGYNFRFQNNTLVTGPFIGIDYLHGSVDAYSETGGGLGALRFNKQSFESLVTRVGWSTSKKFHTDWADITPQFRLSYERQNIKNNGTSVSLINAPFSAAGGNQTPGQDYMVIGTGVNFQFTPDFNMQLGYQTQIFRDNMTSHFASVRFGYKF